MPVADRTKKLSQKELAQDATKPGQTKLDSFFVCASISPATDSAYHDSAQVTSSKQVEYLNNVNMEESLTCDISSEENCVSTIKADNFSVKKSEFTAVMKNKNLREKRYFQNEWLEKYNWLRYYLKKRSAFCTVCTDYAQPNDSSPFIYRVDAGGFKNWKRGREKLLNHARSRFHKNTAENAKHICTSRALKVQLNNRSTFTKSSTIGTFFSSLHNKVFTSARSCNSK